ncbi:MAG: serine acetyltransferase [SAR324 cluster bacterium]|jgi:serine O-acetyltransferase|nr:serine acetyltransferase [SAR324 cluster bacterium]MCH2266966.1 serine acetyltransferase [SAR324 cluster bacterium]
MATKQETRLQNSIDALMASYHEHPEIEHIGNIDLPVKENIVALIEDIQALLFPGLIRQESFDYLNLPHVVGQQTVSIFYRLKEAIEMVLCWKATEEGKNCDEMPKFGERVENIAFEFLEFLPELRDILSEDVSAILEGDPASVSKREIVLAYPGLQAVSVFRIAHFLHKRDVPLIPRIMTEHVHSKTGVDIHPGVTIGKGLMIDHGTGIVIGETAIIKDQVRLYQGVTLGALSPQHSLANPGLKRHPTIENNVIVYSGATILGDVVIGEGSIIGGNVWLTSSVKPNSRVFLKDAESALEVRVKAS